jgi:hypothetical protein
VAHDATDGIAIVISMLVSALFGLWQDCRAASAVVSVVYSSDNMRLQFLNELKTRDICRFDAQ